MTTRLAQLSEWMKQNDVSFTFIQEKANLFYFTNFYCEPHERLVALLAFPEEDPCLICPNMEVSLAKESGWCGEILGYSDSEDPWQLVTAAIQKREVATQKCAIEKSSLSYGRSEALTKRFPLLQFTDCEEVCMGLRKKKSAKEVEILREAAKLADFGVEVGIYGVQAGRTEMELVALIEFELKRKGVRDMSFSTLVLSGEQSAHPHGKPGSREIKKGDFILFDLGVVLEGYCSDITRTIAYGDISEEQSRIYNTVLQAQQTALSLCQPGTEIGALDRAARNVITNAGYGAYPHRIGHGLGIDVHELPSLNKTNKELLEEGMTFTIEPGIYVPSIGGVRIEDDVLLTKSGYECLTQYPKELTIVS
ncbi:M24 family metallopeptidase [Halalkalibacterium ligniniphilum]|uniref:M24 family metallopeptidase n=1 Tax=Halalkalibacterium ligniniphilum TaxID=1134413 RepID=UPI00034D646F|nr:Xaa-Pro peptidase family protein [Halalkalibacterium ligniniphilum]